MMIILMMMMMMLKIAKDDGDDYRYDIGVDNDDHFDDYDVDTYIDDSLSIYEPHDPRLGVAGHPAAEPRRLALRHPHGLRLRHEARLRPGLVLLGLVLLHHLHLHVVDLLDGGHARRQLRVVDDAGLAPAAQVGFDLGRPELVGRLADVLAAVLLVDPAEVERDVAKVVDRHELGLGDEGLPVEEPFDAHVGVADGCKLALKLGGGHLPGGHVRHLRDEARRLLALNVEDVVFGEEHLGVVLPHGLVHVDHAHGGLAGLVLHLTLQVLLADDLQLGTPLDAAVLVGEDALVDAGVTPEGPVNVQDDKTKVVDGVGTTSEL